MTTDALAESEVVEAATSGLLQHRCSSTPTVVKSCHALSELQDLTFGAALPKHA